MFLFCTNSKTNHSYHYPLKEIFLKKTAIVLLILCSTVALAEESEPRKGCFPLDDTGEYPMIIIGGIPPEQQPFILATLKKMMRSTPVIDKQAPPAISIIQCGVCTPSD